MTLQSVSRGLTLARVNKNVILIKTSGNSITIRCRCGTEKKGRELTIRLAVYKKSSCLRYTTLARDSLKACIKVSVSSIDSIQRIGERSEKQQFCY